MSRLGPMRYRTYRAMGNVMRNRKLNRLPDYDYSQDGWYFVTICVKDREELFGKIKNQKMILNDYGWAVEKCWLEIPDHFPQAFLDEFIIMSNHVHGVIVINNNGIDSVGNKNFCSLQSPKWQTKLSGSLSSIIRGFKIGVTKWCRKNNDDYFQWQKSFYDHIIRDQKSLQNIRQYIKDNPLQWQRDRNNQENIYY